MTELKTSKNTENEIEPFPLQPHYHPIHKIPKKIYEFLASAKLAMILLVAILMCSLAGVTIVRDKRAWDLIFSTIWFNALLVLLVINVACCFFGRIWGRRITLISFGMILFHLSFVTMFAGIIYNSFFYFRGSIRLTEGEILPNNDPQSYDTIDQGRFFSFTKLKGDTTIYQVHTGFNVDGEDKRAAYEVGVGSGQRMKNATLYMTKHLDYRGFSYFPEKEGYSVLAVIYDKHGKEIFGAFLPLQSLQNKADGIYVYTTGTKEGPSVINFPVEPNTPFVSMNVSFLPVKAAEKTGDIYFDIYPVIKSESVKPGKPYVSGKVAVGTKFNAAQYLLEVKEVRYWASMTVRYEPGKPIVLTSLWVGLFGVTLTTLARVFRKKNRHAPL